MLYAVVRSGLVPLAAGLRSAVCCTLSLGPAWYRWLLVSGRLCVVRCRQVRSGTAGCWSQVGCVLYAVVRSGLVPLAAGLRSAVCCTLSSGPVWYRWLLVSGRLCVVRCRQVRSGTAGCWSQVGCVLYAVVRSGLVPLAAGLRWLCVVRCRQVRSGTAGCWSQVGCVLYAVVQPGTAGCWSQVGCVLYAVVRSGLVPLAAGLRSAVCCTLSSGPVWYRWLLVSGRLCVVRCCQVRSGTAGCWSQVGCVLYAVVRSGLVPLTAGLRSAVCCTLSSSLVPLAVGLRSAVCCTLSSGPVWYRWLLVSGRLCVVRCRQVRSGTSDCWSQVGCVLYAVVQPGTAGCWSQVGCVLYAVVRSGLVPLAAGLRSAVCCVLSSGPAWYRWLLVSGRLCVERCCQVRSGTAGCWRVCLWCWRCAGSSGRTRWARPTRTHTRGVCCSVPTAGRSSSSTRRRTTSRQPRSARRSAACHRSLHIRSDPSVATNYRAWMTLSLLGANNCLC